MATSPIDDPSPAPAAVQPEPNPSLPIPDEPGAHPIGASLGAVGAGAAGAALGAVGGPIGVVVGAIVGAVAGAIIGKEAAETVNPTGPVAPPSESRVGEGRAAAFAAEPPPAITTPEETRPAGSVVGRVAAPLPPAHPPAQPMVSATEETVSPPPGRSRLQRVTFTPPPPPVDLTVQESYPEGNVRDAAYFRYLHRLEHGLPGDELTDWAEAEREVLRG